MPPAAHHTTTWLPTCPDGTKICHIPCRWRIFVEHEIEGSRTKKWSSSSTALPGNWELSWHAGVFCGARFPRLAEKDGLSGYREERGALPLHATRAHARRGRIFSWETLTRERAETAFVVASLGSRVASRRKPGRFRNFWSSARGRDAPEHMSTNATAAIAGPQGGGKAGGGRKWGL